MISDTLRGLSFVRWRSGLPSSMMVYFLNVLYLLYVVTILVGALKSGVCRWKKARWTQASSYFDVFCEEVAPPWCICTFQCNIHFSMEFPHVITCRHRAIVAMCNCSHARPSVVQTSSIVGTDVSSFRLWKGSIPSMEFEIWQSANNSLQIIILIASMRLHVVGMSLQEAIMGSSKRDKNTNK